MRRAPLYSARAISARVDCLGHQIPHVRTQQFGPFTAQRQRGPLVSQLNAQLTSFTSRQVPVGASSLVALPQSHRRLGPSLQGVTVTPLGPTIGAAECGAARDGTIPFSPGHAAGAASGRHLKQLLFVPNIGVSQATPPAIDAMLDHLQVRNLGLGDKAVSKMTVVPNDSEQGRTEDHFCGARKPLSHAVDAFVTSAIVMSEVDMWILQHCVDTRTLARMDTVHCYSGQDSLRLACRCHPRPKR